MNELEKYVESVEKANTHLKNIRDKLEEENSMLRIKNNNLIEQNEYLEEKIEEVRLKYTKTGHETLIKDLTEENDELKRMLQLVSESESVSEHDSVKEIVRNQLAGLDTVTYESAMAWNDYCILNKFFKEYYDGELWDNYD